MKIGILTKHSVPNYGAILQAYALCTRLRTDGFDAEIVDYHQPATTRYYRFKWSVAPALRHLLRLRRCNRFVQRWMHLSPFQCTSIEEFRDYLPRYSHLLTGSDQVWFTGPVQYYDPMYFLDFPFRHGSKISYAPSAGQIDSFGEFETRVSRSINDIKHLSVRDSNTASLISKLTGRQPSLVVDPTFLHTFSELLSPTRPLKEPYLLLFGKIPEPYAQLVVAEAAAQGLSRIVSLQYDNSIATNRIAAPSPLDWLNYFYHAEKVVTTYFHGSVFSIKFRKPFISIPTHGRVKKVSSMLADAGLSDRCFVGSPDIQRAKDKLSMPVDWTSADGSLRVKIESSMRFLEAALA